eukprot:SAG31_NODE_635_length_13360_cov_4.229847_13_plen_341_part_00
MPSDQRWCQFPPFEEVEYVGTAAAWWPRQARNAWAAAGMPVHQTHSVEMPDANGSAEDPNCATAVLARGASGNRLHDVEPNEANDWQRRMNAALDARMAGGFQRLTDAALARILTHHCPVPAPLPPKMMDLSGEAGDVGPTAQSHAWPRPPVKRSIAEKYKAMLATAVSPAQRVAIERMAARRSLRDTTVVPRNKPLESKCMELSSGSPEQRSAARCCFLCLGALSSQSDECTAHGADKETTETSTSTWACPAGCPAEFCRPCAERYFAVVVGGTHALCSLIALIGHFFFTISAQFVTSPLHLCSRFPLCSIGRRLPTLQGACTNGMVGTAGECRNAGDI